MFNLLFDFDGTLFDTRAAHTKAFNLTFKRLDLYPSTDLNTIDGRTTYDIISNFTDDINLINNFCSYKSYIYTSLIPEIKPLIDFNLLESIKNIGGRMFIVSNGRRYSIEKLLIHYNILSMFDGIITSDDFENSKPNPEPYLFCIEKYNIQGSIYGIEDSKIGMESVLNSGIIPIGVHSSELNKATITYYESINDFLFEIINKYDS
jgi:beta-phosphoglucomutase